MALIKCPECGTEVSDKADKCPKCAYPLIPIAQKTANEQPAKTEDQGFFMKVMNEGCLTFVSILVLIVIGVIIYFVVQFFSK